MNDFEDINTSSKTDLDDSRLGLVYLLHRNNGAPIVKIGYTSKSAESRALNYTDGEWIVNKEYFMPIWLAKLTEKAAHDKLAPYWLDPKLTGGTASEIFTCSIDYADTAIKLAHVEQLEKALNSLGIPKVLITLILNDKELSSSSSATEIENKINNVLKTSAKEKENLISKVNDLQMEINTANDCLIKEKAFHESEVLSLKEKISMLETKINSYEVMLRSSVNDFANEIELIENFSEKKINPKDFDKLRDAFRKSIEIIRIMRAKEYGNF